MASSTSSPHLFIPNKRLHSHQSALNSSCKLNVRMDFGNPAFLVLGSKSNDLLGIIYTSQTSHSGSKRYRRFSSPSVSSFVMFNPIRSESVHLADKASKNDVKYNQIDSLVRVLHRSARNFSVAIKHRDSARSSPELAKAWIGVDVHAWHKHIAYQVAVYAFLKTAIEGKFLLSADHWNDITPVQEIISPKISMLLEYMECQLNSRDQNLTKWFKIVQLPLLEGFFIPSFRRWSAEHDRSGVAVIFLAISCCVAVVKLGSERISCSEFTLSIPDTIRELMDLTHDRVPTDILHSLASAAGVEREFLSHFGAKVLPNKESQQVSFWIGLVQRKLSVAFEREGLISKMHDNHNKQDLENNLAILGLFAFLGSRTRLFLSRMAIKDIDEQLKDFLSYLECGSLLIYPEFSSLPLYQLFMEVVAEEIGWLDLYATIPGINKHKRKRSKHHAIQAEKEITLSAVFSVCSDVCSGFSHFRSTAQYSLEDNMNLFCFQSRDLLNMCLEDYWAAYYRSGELLKYEGRFVPQQIIPYENQCTTYVSAVNGVRRKSSELIKLGFEGTAQGESELFNPDGADAITIIESPSSSETKNAHVGWLKNYCKKMISTSFDILLGTRLLFIDISLATGIFLKQLRGHMLTQRERKKLKRTLLDFAAVIPVTFLMLLPVSAVGHAAMLAGIKKYIPGLIPSSYSSERLEIVKQLNRIKKMEIKTWNNV